MVSNGSISQQPDDHIPVLAAFFDNINVPVMKDIDCHSNVDNWHFEISQKLTQSSFFEQVNGIPVVGRLVISQVKFSVIDDVYIQVILFGQFSEEVF